MSNDPENLVLVYLRRIDKRLDRLEDMMADIVGRNQDHARAIVALRRDQAADAETTAHVEIRVDKLNERVNRIEKRLDLSET